MQHIFACTGHDLKLPRVVNSDGVHVIDEDGTRYMDLESGVWCTSLGHGHPRVNEAIAKQVDWIMHAGFCYSTPVVDEAAARVLHVTGMTGGKCVFLCSGSEAIEIGRQIARHLTGHRTSITLHDSYLGAYSSVSDRTRGWHLFDWTRCRDCPIAGRCDLECDLMRQIPEDVSEFIFEPGSSSGFVRFPPPPMIRNIAEVVRGNGGMILVNEVTTGTGRTGMWFGYQHYDLNPDLIAVGKGIGNGYPVSVAVISETLVRRLEDRPFRYAQSHQNDPLGAAVAGTVIDIIEEGGLIAEAARKGAWLIAQLETLVDGEVLLEVRGRGLMAALDVRDRETTERIHNALIARGFIVGNRGSFLRIDPPLTITDAELERFVVNLRFVIDGMRG